MGSGLLFPAMATATLVIVFVQAAAGQSEMNMLFYMTDNLTGSSETAFPVAGFNGSSSDPGKFGTLVIINDAITKRPEITKSDTDNLVGRAQGTYINTNPVTGLDFLMLFTIIFQNMEYNGSTLQIQGTETFGRPQREYAVVGGTGKFRFARGHVVCTTESSSGKNAVPRFNITFRTN
uniref:Dirigent protein n=1 Tax=Picea sitchensis TaxID=3332 RepID=A6YR02_PICSI|nr:unknown [Picea sitchensis]ABR27722.1 dirigent-like protein [Picea sitchensis]